MKIHHLPPSPAPWVRCPKLDTLGTGSAALGGEKSPPRGRGRCPKPDTRLGVHHDTVREDLLGVGNPTPATVTGRRPTGGRCLKRDTFPPWTRKAPGRRTRGLSSRCGRS